jgi:hypothetical protein
MKESTFTEAGVAATVRVRSYANAMTKKAPAHGPCCDPQRAALCPEPK